MKQKTYPVAIPVRFVVVMVAFLAAILFANANLSFAASGKMKSSAMANTSAVAHTEAQIKQLRGALNITPAQEESWNNLTRVMRENAKEMDAFSDARAKERTDGTKTLNAVEHMKLHSQIMKAHLDQMEKLIPPFEAFYSGMSDQQKNITDILFRTGKHQKSKKK
jgi:hypothetical protein